MKLYKVKKSKIDNFGLYASKDIKKGTRVIEYKGKVITRREAEENPKYDNGKAIYLFNINKRYDLDGDFKFNTARLINHSCDPNCEVTGTGLKVWVHAIKDIKKVMNFLMITDLVLMKIIKTTLVGVNLKIVVVISLEKDQDGVLKKKSLENKFPQIIYT